MFSYIAYVFLWAFSFLPFGLLYLFSDIAYFFVYYLFRYRRGVVRANLCNAFPEKSLREIKGIERKFYCHLIDTSVEFYKLWRMSASTMRKRCVFKNPEIPLSYLGEGRDVLIILGHYGNWEWLSSFGLYINDAHFLVLYKPLHNKLIDRLTKFLRARFGAVPVPKNDMVREINRCRVDKEKFVLCMVADQTPRGSNSDLWMTFLNQETPVYRGAEKIASKYDMPVLFLGIQKVRRGYYEAEYLVICDYPGKLPSGEITKMHTRVLEKTIRDSPEYWLWSHRRWKHRRSSGTPLNNES
jgi:KDO2-lipid IV(A) lauroyltransferase